MKFRKIYIIISQTGTMLSKLIRLYTGDRYNHASIALDSELNHMYSFGRVNPYNPVLGGFIKESPTSGTFKRFNNTNVAIIELCIPAEKYTAIKQELEEMYDRKQDYHYNYKGLFLAMFNRPRHKIGCFYCSEFVYEFCRNYGIELGVNGKVIRPMDLFNIPGGKLIFEGSLNVYTRIKQIQKRKRLEKAKNGLM